MSVAGKQRASGRSGCSRRGSVGPHQRHMRCPDSRRWLGSRGRAHLEGRGGADGQRRAAVPCLADQVVESLQEGRAGPEAGTGQMEQAGGRRGRRGVCGASHMQRTDAALHAPPRTVHSKPMHPSRGGSGNSHAKAAARAPSGAAAALPPPVPRSAAAHPSRPPTCCLSQPSCAATSGRNVAVRRPPLAGSTNSTTRPAPNEQARE